jgi:hypothetical protein
MMQIDGHLLCHDCQIAVCGDYSGDEIPEEILG